MLDEETTSLDLGKINDNATISLTFNNPESKKSGQGSSSGNHSTQESSSGNLSTAGMGMTPFMFGAASKNSEMQIDEQLRGEIDGSGEAAIGFETQLPLVRAQE